MEVSVNRQSNVAAYTQIKKQIIFAMATGALKPGDSLPSIKELARQARIHSMTAVKVYEDLRVMGLIYSLRGEGSFVEKGAAEKARQRCHTEIIKTLHQTALEAKAAGMSKKDLREVISVTLKTDSVLYGDVPKAVMALAKGE